MYINTGYQITNTPTKIVAGYNTWQYNVPVRSMYQKTPYYYTDHNGNIRTWNEWAYPRLMHIQGGTYAGTPTRTGSYYLQNVII